MPSQRVTRLARIAVLGGLMLGLFGCDVVSTVTEGFKEAKAVENDLQQATGMRPDVGFEWKNGNLVQVTVAFPQLYDSKPVGELAAAVRKAVATEFKQKPRQYPARLSCSSRDRKREQARCQLRPGKQRVDRSAA